MIRLFCENMRITLLLSTIVIVSAGSIEPSPRSVNVALETSFLFEPKDINDNISFIKNIKIFLDNLYKILAPQARPIQKRQFRAQAERKFSFLDFIKDAGENFMNFTESKITDAVEIVQVEVKHLVDKSKDTIKELLPNRRFKAYIQHSVNHLDKVDPETLRENVRKMMDEDNPVLVSFAHKMNDYYDEADVKRMHKLFRKLNRYLENRMDASKVVKEFLHVVILDKYKSLNKTAKANLIKDLENVAEHLTANKKFKFKIQGKNNPIVVKRKDPVALELVIGDKTKVPESSESKQDNNIFNDLKKIGKHLKINGITVTEDDNKKKGVATNEIIVDNIELIVQSVKKP